MRRAVLEGRTLIRELPVKALTDGNHRVTCYAVTRETDRNGFPAWVLHFETDTEYIYHIISETTPTRNLRFMAEAFGVLDNYSPDEFAWMLRGRSAMLSIMHNGDRCSFMWFPC